ncbi:helix-turn-helix domain-containing protein [Mycobacterium avium]|uniref:helix-turn-helix domain-containing protein n=1 Tax=Mycobacterium avium TaxID=1764 RepID=UPI0012DA4E36|nr:helix-turn-helix domain-containing protein [Mycobacterium avium]
MRRTKANVEDLAAFFDARERADAVEEWLAERQQALAAQAAARRAGHRLQCGSALRAMRDRGETVREIARMAGISEKTVRELIRETESAEPAPAALRGGDVAGAGVGDSDTLCCNEPSVGGGPAVGRSWESVSVRA